MKILIADDVVAESTALRGFFIGKKPKSDRGAKTKRTKSVPGQTIVSFARKHGKSKQGKRAALDCSGIDLSNQPELLATILDALGISLLNRGCPREGAELIELALAIRRKVFGPNHPTTALSLQSFARVERERGDYGSAETVINEALRINRKAFGPMGLPVAGNLNELGAIQIYQSRFVEAEASAIEGLAILTALAIADTDRNTTRLMDIRGRAERALGKITGADATFKALLDLDRKQLGTTDHPKYATHVANYAAVKIAQKDFKSAKDFYDQAIAVYEALDRPSHPNLVDTYANLGSLLRRRNANPTDLQDALTLAQKALALNSQIRSTAHELVGNDHANVGRAHYALGDLSAAAKSFARAVDIYDRNAKRGRFDEEHAYLAEALTWQARVLVEGGTVGFAAKAEPLLERARKIWPVHLGSGSIGEAIANACLGRALFLQAKDPARAVQLLRDAYPMIAKVIGAADPFTDRVASWVKETESKIQSAR